jgi:hypothetical protein
LRGAEAGEVLADLGELVDQLAGTSVRGVDLLACDADEAGAMLLHELGALLAQAVARDRQRIPLAFRLGELGVKPLGGRLGPRSLSVAELPRAQRLCVQLRSVGALGAEVAGALLGLGVAAL